MGPRGGQEGAKRGIGEAKKKDSPTSFLRFLGVGVFLGVLGGLGVVLGGFWEGLGMGWEGFGEGLGGSWVVLERVWGRF